MKTCRLLQIAIVVLWLLGSGEAYAASGVVKGRLVHYRNNGGYCPTARNCVGSNYPQSQFHVWAPISNGKVRLYMRNSAGVNEVRGSATTNYNGEYTIGWSTTAATAGSSTVQFMGEHKDGRFELRNQPGGLYASWQTTPFAPTKGTTTATAQNLGETRFGTATTPDPHLNFYDAAHMTWWYGLMGSNKLYSVFTDVKLRGVFENNDCGTCGSGSGKFVRLNGQFDFEATTVAHEIGHVASYLLNPRSTTGDYCYGQTPSKCTYPSSFCCVNNIGIGSHTQSSAEWQQVQFEEGFASAIATIALNQQSAPDPTFCTGNQGVACAPNSTTQMEPSTGSAAACSATAKRSENSVTRYIWDAYDRVVDPGFPENKNAYYWRLYDTIPQFFAGYVNGANNEPLDCPTSSTCVWDNRDGFSSVDFWGKAMKDAAVGDDLWYQYEYNCGFAGSGN